MLHFTLLPELRVGLLNAWLPLAFYHLILLTVSFSVSKDASMKGGSLSCVPKKDMPLIVSSGLSFFLFMILSVGIPLQTGTLCSHVGLPLYLVGVALGLMSVINYTTTPVDKLVTKGLYQFSRNPGYITEHIVSAAVALWSGALWLLPLVIARMVLAHYSILAEERYCSQRYGDAYVNYFREVPRYFRFMA